MKRQRSAKKSVQPKKKKQAARKPVDDRVPVELICDDETIAALRETAKLARTDIDTVVAVMLALRILRDKESVSEFVEGL
jgi:hypothetical protein